MGWYSRGGLVYWCPSLNSLDFGSLVVLGRGWIERSIEDEVLDALRSCKVDKALGTNDFHGISLEALGNS